jgi:hypothetical protein
MSDDINQALAMRGHLLDANRNLEMARGNLEAAVKEAADADADEVLRDLLGALRTVSLAVSEEYAVWSQMFDYHKSAL